MERMSWPLKCDASSHKHQLRIVQLTVSDRVNRICFLNQLNAKQHTLVYLTWVDLN